MKTKVIFEVSINPKGNWFGTSTDFGTTMKGRTFSELRSSISTFLDSEISDEEYEIKYIISDEYIDSIHVGSLDYSKIFDEEFKYSLNEVVRHKADIKLSNYSTTDFGLLILEKYFAIELDGDKGTRLNRSYICREVKSSGSGSIGRYSENELLSQVDFDTDQAKKSEERNQISTNMKNFKDEIYTAFGVNERARIQLIGPDGKVDDSVTYRVRGYHSESRKKATLNLSSIFSIGEDEVSVDVTDPKEIYVLKD